MKRTHCPTCTTTVKLPADNEFFPFCGPRCRSADLGRWLDGDYTLAEKPGAFFEDEGGEAWGDLLPPKGTTAVVALFVAMLMASPATAQTTDAGTTASGSTTSTTSTTSTASADTAPARAEASPPAAAHTEAQPAPPPPDVAPAAAATPAPAAPPEDEGDHGIVYLGADFGYSWVNLVQFSSNNFIPAGERLDGNGWTFAVDAGFRIYWFTVGVRGTLASYPGFEIGTAGVDLGFHIPIPVVEPYVRGGLGYGWLGQANYRDPGLSETSVSGLVADVGAGVDIYLSNHISIGAGVDGAFLNLTRQKITTGAASMIGDVNVSESGDAVGLQLRFHGQLTFHF